jgi:outer membrane protein assembly factor BamD (BamD/ComL family)
VIDGLNEQLSFINKTIKRIENPEKDVTAKELYSEIKNSLADKAMNNADKALSKGEGWLATLRKKIRNN